MWHAGSTWYYLCQVQRRSSLSQSSQSQQGKALLKWCHLEVILDVVLISSTCYSTFLMCLSSQLLGNSTQKPNWQKLRQTSHNKWLLFSISVRVTDVSWTITFPDRHFPDNTFTGCLCVLTRQLYFPYKTFPGQSLSQTDVSWTICINNFEDFGMFT